MTQENTVGSSERTLRILEALSRNEGMGVTELAEDVSIPKSTIHNHLSTLLENEYIVKDGNLYRVGLRFLELGAKARTRNTLYEKGKAEVDKLAQSTGELANMATEEFGEGVYLSLSKGEEAVELDTYAGKRFNLHCTALGKAILASLPMETVEAILDRHGLPRRTPNTITDREELLAKLDEIAERGYAYDLAERLEGLRCVSAPIRGLNDELLGAVSVSGPTSRMKKNRISDELAEQLLDAANVIELNIKYR